MKKCRVCKSEFEPARPLQKVCGFLCARAFAESERQKKARKLEQQAKRDTRQRLEGMKTVPQLIAEADRAFCAYIRARDEGKPCICCGRYENAAALTGGGWDAGHYRTRGAASSLRYDERNCHKQLKQCNRRSFDVASYRRNLIDRIGLDAVESLESDNAPHKWSREELRGIAATYKRKLTEIKNGKA